MCLDQNQIEHHEGDASRCSADDGDAAIDNDDDADDRGDTRGCVESAGGATPVVEMALMMMSMRKKMMTG